MLPNPPFGGSRQGVKLRCLPGGLVVASVGVGAGPMVLVGLVAWGELQH